MNHTSMNKLKIGLVQMSCTVDKADNLSKAIEGIRDAHQKVHRLSAYRSCLPHCISVMRKTMTTFRWLRQYQDHQLIFFLSWLRNLASSLLPRCLKKGSRSLSQHYSCSRCRWFLSWKIQEDAYP